MIRPCIKTFRNNLRSDLNKVKNVKKVAEVKVAEVEAKVKKVTDKVPTTSAKKKTTK